MSIKSQKDFVSGLMFTAIGAGFAWNSALSYDIGSASQMGPGYFPLVLGLVLVLLVALTTSPARTACLKKVEAHASTL